MAWSPPGTCLDLAARYSNLAELAKGVAKPAVRLFDAEGFAHGRRELAAAVEQPGPESHDFRQ